MKGRIFFTSDLHIGHANLFTREYRVNLWDSVDDHDEDLITRWNETVTPQDTVFVLGDFALGRRARNVPKAKRMNGTKILVPGNHDTCWSGAKTPTKNLPLYVKSGFWVAHEMFRYGTGNKVATVCHFPFRGEGKGKSGEETYISKYYDYMPEDDGGWLFHGHVHDAWKVKGRQINVGVDVWDFRPVQAEELFALMEE